MESTLSFTFRLSHYTTLILTHTNILFYLDSDTHVHIHSIPVCLIPTNAHALQYSASDSYKYISIWFTQVQLLALWFSPTHSITLIHIHAYMYTNVFHYYLIHTHFLHIWIILYYSVWFIHPHIFCILFTCTYILLYIHT